MVSLVFASEVAEVEVEGVGAGSSLARYGKFEPVALGKLLGERVAISHAAVSVGIVGDKCSADDVAILVACHGHIGAAWVSHAVVA